MFETCPLLSAENLSKQLKGIQENQYSIRCTWLSPGFGAPNFSET